MHLSCEWQPAPVSRRQAETTCADAVQARRHDPSLANTIPCLKWQLCGRFPFDSKIPGSVAAHYELGSVPGSFLYKQFTEQLPVVSSAHGLAGVKDHWQTGERLEVLYQ